MGHKSQGQVAANRSGFAGLMDTVRQAASMEVLIACGIAFAGISVVSAAGPVLGNIQDHFLIPTTLVGLVGSAFGLARGGTSAILAQVIPAHQRGSAVGVYRLAGDLGVLSGPFLMTWIIDFADHRAAMLVAAAVAGMVIIGAWRLIGPCVLEDQ